MHIAHSVESQKISTTQIFRQTNFGKTRAQQGYFDKQTFERFSKIGFTEKSSSKILEFSHCDDYVQHQYKTCLPKTCLDTFSNN